MESPAAQAAENVRRQEGFLPAKTEVNPRLHVNAITVGNRKEVFEASGKDSEEVEVVELDGNSILGTGEILSIDTTSMCRSIECYAISDTTDRKPPVDRHNAHVDRHVAQNSPLSSESSNSSEARVYKPKLPFPRAINIRSPEEKGRHAQPQLRKLQKITNPGMFMVPCSIKGMEFKNSLCDTRANVNVMSESVARKLGIKDLQPSKMSIILPDSSSPCSKGFIPDLMLQVGDCLVLVDFHLMETKNDKERPLILGSSFLATVGAIVDFPNQRISFSKINKDVFYPSARFEKNSCLTVTNEEESSSNVGDDTKEIPYAPPLTSPPSPAKAKRKKTSKPFSKFSIIIPMELSEKGEEVIQEMMLNTMKLLPGVVPFTDPPET